MGKYATQIKRIPLYFAGGQSNIGGRGYYPTYVGGANGVTPVKYRVFGTDDNMQIFWRSTYNDDANTGSWQALDMYVNNVNPNIVATERFGITDVLIKELADYKGSTIAMIKCTQGGSNMYSDWKSPNGQEYKNAIAQIEDGLNKVCQLGIPELKICMWLSGWSDADTQPHADAFGSNLSQLMGEIESTISNYIRFTPKWLVGESPDWVAVGMRPSAPYNAVIAAQQTLGNTGNNIFVENTNMTLWSVDNIHLTAASYEAVGLEWFDLIKDL